MKKTLVTLIAIVLVAIVSCVAQAADAAVNEDKIVTVDGFGSAPQSVGNPAQAMTLARRAALVDGSRNMLEAVEAVQIDAETTVADAMVSSDTVRSKITGYIKGAKVIKEGWAQDGIYQVTLQLDLNSVLAAAGLGRIGGSTSPAVIGKLDPQLSAGAITGLVIDARGTRFYRSLTPFIYDSKGRLLYSGNKVDYNLVKQIGMAGYDTGGDAGAIERTGSSPLVVKLAGLRDGNRSIVVSEADADDILRADRLYNFLSQAKVVIMIDR